MLNKSALISLSLSHANVCQNTIFVHSGHQCYQIEAIIDFGSGCFITALTNLRTMVVLGRFMVEEKLLNCDL
jgi:hypothetical protein